MSSSDTSPPGVPLAPIPEIPSSAPSHSCALEAMSLAGIVLSHEEAPLHVTFSDCKPMPSSGKPTPYTPGNPRHAALPISTDLNSLGSVTTGSKSDGESPQSRGSALRAHTETLGNTLPTTVPDPLAPGPEPFPLPDSPAPGPTFPSPNADPRPVQVGCLPILIPNPVMVDAEMNLPLLTSYLGNGEFSQSQGDIVAVTKSLRRLGYTALDASEVGFKDVSLSEIMVSGPVHPVPGPNAPGPVGPPPPFVGRELSKCGGSESGIRKITGCPCEDCEDSGPDAPEESKFCSLDGRDSQPSPVGPALSGNPVNPSNGKKGFRKYHDIFNDDEDYCPEGEGPATPGTGPSAGGRQLSGAGSHGSPAGPDPVGPPPKFTLQALGLLLKIMLLQNDDDDDGYDGDTEKNRLDGLDGKGGDRNIHHHLMSGGSLSLRNIHAILRKIDSDSGYESGESTDQEDGGGVALDDDSDLSPDEGPDGGVKLKPMLLEAACALQLIAQLKPEAITNLEHTLSMVEAGLGYPSATACGFEALRDQVAVMNEGEIYLRV